MKKTLAVFFACSLGFFAADRRNIAEIGTPMDRAAARAMWKSAGIESQQFPQASAIITVESSPQAFEVGRQVVVSFVSTALVANACVSGYIIPPNDAGAIELTTFCYGSTAGYIGANLWNGAFPDGWPSGNTRFRVLIMGNDGKVTEVNSYVPVQASSGLSRGPIVNSISAAADGQHLVVEGNFAAPLFAVNGVAATATAGAANVSTGQNFTFIELPTPLNNGNGILTVCAGGWCSQTYFHLQQPTATAVAPQGGKG